MKNLKLFLTIIFSLTITFSTKANDNEDDNSYAPLLTENYSSENLHSDDGVGCTPYPQCVTESDYFEFMKILNSLLKVDSENESDNQSE